MFNIHGFSIKSQCPSNSLIPRIKYTFYNKWNLGDARHGQRSVQIRGIRDGSTRVPSSELCQYQGQYVIQKPRTLSFRFLEFGDAAWFTKAAAASFRHVLYKAPSSNKTHVMKQSDQTRPVLWRCLWPGQLYGLHTPVNNNNNNNT